jgi:diacylglycerol kinase (ATP)
MSFLHAWRGVRFVFVTQPNAWIHALAVVLVVALGLVVGISRSEWLAVTLAIGLVLTAEALNTAIEVLGDAVSEEAHPVVGRAKDVAAGGVLLASVCALGVGVIVFGEAIVGVAGWLLD